MNRRTMIKTTLGAMGMATYPLQNAFASNPDISGFKYIDEAAPHERTFMQWPVNREVHPESSYLIWLQKTIATIANTIADFEPVVMLMAKEHEVSARKYLSASVEVWDIATDDLWCRDSGAHFLSNGNSLTVSHLNFNGWGNKQTHDNDGKIARKIAERLGVPFFDNGIVGEAGGIEANGTGLLLAHESSWVNPNRNSGTRAEIEGKLLEAYGGRKMIWAPGIAGADITDYHIDSLARLIGDDTVLIQMPYEISAEDPWSVAALETRKILEAATTIDGKLLIIKTLTEPARTRSKSADFVSAYANYYICNGAIIAPEFGDAEADQACAETLQQLYPGRQIVQLNIDAVGEIGGGIHCATHEQPAVT